MCGFQVRGTEDQVVAALQEHGRVDHGSVSSREAILDMATSVPATGTEDGGDG